MGWVLIAGWLATCALAMLWINRPNAIPLRGRRLGIVVAALAILGMGLGLLWQPSLQDRAIIREVAQRLPSAEAAPMSCEQVEVARQLVDRASQGGAKIDKQGRISIPSEILARMSVQDRSALTALAAQAQACDP